MSDSSPDAVFYAEPRFVEHVDERAAERMASYISDRLLHRGDSVLDLCSSWTSHIRPAGASELGLERVAGLGMNAEELAANPGIVKSKNVRPPIGLGRVSLVCIGENSAVDSQPCGGTHVSETQEVGAIHIAKIEKKGKENRRFRIRFGTPEA